MVSKLTGDGIVIASGSSDPASGISGQLFYNTTDGAVKYNNGSTWTKVAAKIPLLNSVTGDIWNGLSGRTLTLSGSNFLSSNLTVHFNIGGSDTDVSITASNDTTATVTIPAAVYNTSGGTSVNISVTNNDNARSANVSKTIQGTPSGGSITTTNGYRVHKFESSSTFTVPSGFSKTVEYAIVAGGGGGGYGNPNEGGGGGGAGGMITSSTSPSSGNYTVTVGAGGTKTNSSSNANNGGNSSVFSVTALGGGGGAYCSGSSGNSGGSGGGGSGCGQDWPGGAGTSGQGNAGGKGAWTGGGSYGSSGNGGGGGGKTSAGQYGELRTSGTRGGEGAGQNLDWVSGSNVEYARGGLGGAGRSNYLPPDVAGGTGQGGTGGSNQIGGNGGSGVVLIRYQL